MKTPPKKTNITPMIPKKKPTATTPPNAEAGCLLEATTTEDATTTNTRPTTRPDGNNRLNEIRAELDKPVAQSAPSGTPNHATPKVKRESDASIRIMVQSALDTPFIIVRGITGSERFKIMEEIKPDLINIGVQVYKDFGPEAYAKWINLAIFTLLYGSTWYTAFAGYFADQKAKKAEAKKAQEKPNAPEAKPEADSEAYRQKALEREKQNAAEKK